MSYTVTIIVNFMKLCCKIVMKLAYLSYKCVLFCHLAGILWPYRSVVCDHELYCELGPTR